ncbi:MAG: tetratricopeptide repeat protein [Sediminibacterium sp.]|nr:tetratricopeptide repeat protein [Sediminibacterium sp.]
MKFYFRGGFYVFICIFLFLLPLLSKSQQFNIGREQEQQVLNEAKALFFIEDYFSCYQLLKLYFAKNKEVDYENIIELEGVYYYVVSGIKNGDTTIFQLAEEFIQKNIFPNYDDRVNYNLGYYFYYNKDFKRAKKYLQSLSFYNLTNHEISEVKFELGYIYFIENDFDSALHLLKIITQLPQDHYYYEANYYVGLILINKGDFLGAEKYFITANKNSTFTNYIPYYLAQIKFLNKNPKEAEKIALEALADPNIKNVLQLRQLLSQIYFERNEYFKALSNFQSFIYSYPKVTANDYFKFAFCYYKNKNYDSALFYLKRIQSNTDSNQVAILNLLANIYILKGQKINAKNVLFSCLQLFSSNNTAYFEVKLNYIKILIELKEHSFALNQIQSFMDSKAPPELILQANNLLIIELAHSNNFIKANLIYNSLNQVSEEAQQVYPNILFGLAREFFNSQQYDSAQFYYLKLLNQNQVQPQILIMTYFWLSQTYYELQNYQLSVNQAEKFITYNNAPKEFVQKANYTLGYDYLELQNYPKAQYYFEKSLPNNINKYQNFEKTIYLKIADCQLMRKMYKQAEEKYQTVYQKKWTDADYALYQLSLLSGAQQNISQKTELLNKLIKNYPQSNYKVEAQMELAETYIIIEDFSQAKNTLETVLAQQPNSAYTPTILLKLAVVCYNMKDNASALKYYDNLFTNYKNASVLSDAENVLKNIFVDEGHPENFIKFLNQHGKSISESEQEKILLDLAQNKLLENNIPYVLEIYQQYLQLPSPSEKCDILEKIIQLYEQTNQPDSAIRFLNQIIADCQVEQKVAAAEKLADIYSKKNLPAQALANDMFIMNYAIDNHLKENTINNMLQIINRNYHLFGYIDSLHKYVENGSYNLPNSIMANWWYIKGLINATAGNKNDSISCLYFNKALSFNDRTLNPLASFEIAKILIEENKLDSAEKYCFNLIKLYEYDLYTLTKTYILLGDIYLKENDLFNAKATYLSVKENSDFEDLKKIVQDKLATLVVPEKIETTPQKNTKKKSANVKKN